METEKIKELYDEEYARNYDQRFIFDKDYKHVADFELEILSKLLGNSNSWLDVGCGTGYFMSKFPNVKRGGMDLSEGMLTVARERNKTALFLEQGDFRRTREDWNNSWDLVTCMWCAYCYVESMSEINRVMQNLSDWTATGGICFLPICDLEDVLFGRVELPHHDPDIKIFGGPKFVNGVVWSYIDNLHNKNHENLLSPHIEYLIKLFKESFVRVETVYYPPYPYPIPGQRKGLLCIGKNAEISGEMNEVIDVILEKSLENKANVLTMEQVEQIFRDAGVETQNPDNSTIFEEEVLKKSGWLRKIWRKSPQGFQKTVRSIIGE